MLFRSPAPMAQRRLAAWSRRRCTARATRTSSQVDSRCRTGIALRTFPSPRRVPSRRTIRPVRLGRDRLARMPACTCRRGRRSSTARRRKPRSSRSGLRSNRRARGLASTLRRTGGSSTRARSGGRGSRGRTSWFPNASSRAARLGTGSVRPHEWSDIVPAPPLELRSAPLDVCVSRR